MHACMHAGVRVHGRALLGESLFFLAVAVYPTPGTFTNSGGPKEVAMEGASWFCACHIISLVAWIEDYLVGAFPN